jgi:hypothetical protein
MQSLAELRGLYGDVTAHLLWSTNGADEDHRDMLAGLGILPLDKKGRVQDTHIGRTVRIRWDDSFGTPRWQQLTRYVFFDPGDDALLDEFDGRSGSMKVERYKTSLGEPAALITLDAGTDDDVQIESQPDGFGIVWPTKLNAAEAVASIMSTLPNPSDGDRAFAIVETPDSTEGLLEEFPSGSVGDVLKRTNGSTAAVRVCIGSAAIGWAAAIGRGEAVGALSFGDDRYVHQDVATLLERTAILSAQARALVLGVADETLQKHLAR